MLRPAGAALAALALLLVAAHAVRSAAPAPAAPLARPERAGGGAATAAATPSPTTIPAAAARSVPVHVVRSAKELPHDRTAFTQGLEAAPSCALVGKDECEDAVWESTGLNGASTLRLVNATTGAVLASRPLPPDAFGEGVTRLPRRGDRPERLLQLTWLSGRAYLYNAANLSDVIETRTLLNDGWGAAYDPRDDRVVLSDGSSSLAWVHAGDPGGALLRHVSVTAPGGAAVPNLNELEWVSPRPGGAPVGGDGGPVPLPSGEVWANVWGTPCVARIDPANGAVVGWILADALAPRAAAAAAAPNAPPGPALDVLNGIAVVTETGRLLMTGKHWPLLFDVALEPGDAGAAARARAACVQPRVSFG